MNPFFAWAWKQDGLRPTCRVLLMLLAERADEFGVVVMAPGELAALTRLSLKTIINAISFLAERGHISVVQGGKGRLPRIYQLRPRT